MGLSDEERITKIYYSILRITEHADKINPEAEGAYGYKDHLKKLKDFSTQLWPAIQSAKGNGLYWLMGPDDEVRSFHTTVWSLGLSNHIERAQKPKEKHPKKDWVYDPINKGSLSVKSLIGPNLAAVKNVHDWLQNIQYAANRYADELSEGLKDLRDLVARMIGEVFAIYNAEPRFASAWLLNEIAQKLYGNISYKLRKDVDDVTKLMLDQNSHHDMTRWAAPENMYRLKIDGKPVELTFLANIKEDEVDAVISNWLPRIEAETAEPQDLLKDLVRYINSKSHFGFKAEIPSS